jgi:hypothetical protein
MSNQNNPFGEQNPFADPSIQNAARNVQVTQKTLDEYNPFAEKNYQSKPAAIIPTDSTATSSTTTQPKPLPQATQPPQYSQTSAQKLNLSDIEKQQEELNRRAAELERREQMLQNGGGGGGNGAAAFKNFPPLPSWCPGPLKPCFYQDISREIPVEFQKWVRVLFYLWMFHTFTLGFNIVAALVVFISLGQGVTFAFSLFYFALFTPLSYICWFRPAYKGFRLVYAFLFYSLIFKEDKFVYKFDNRN